MAYYSIAQDLNFLWNQAFVGSGKGDEATSNGKTTISFLVTHTNLNIQPPWTYFSCI